MTSKRVRLSFLAAALCATTAHAQGPPPFEITPAGSTQSATLSVNIDDPQAFQVGLEAFGQASGDNEQTEDPSDGGRVLIATSINDIDTFCGDDPLPEHNFAVLYWDSPYDPPDPFLDGYDRADFSQEMFYDVNGTGCAGPPDAPLFALASSSHDLAGGTLDVRARAATQAYGYDSVSNGPFGSTGYGHYAESQATAVLTDWVYVTGPNPTATVSLTASFDANFGSVPLPANDSDWFSEAYDEDIRLLAPCGGYEHPDFSGDAERPEGAESSELALGVSIRDEFSSEVVCYEPPEGEPVCDTQWSSTNHGESVYKIDEVVYEWVDTEGIGDCTDDALEANRNEEGSLAGSASVQVEVATSQWIQVRASLHAASSCDTPLFCDLANATGGPTHLSITSPNGTLVAWHGIAGLTRVPEPSGMAAAVAAVVGLARIRRRRITRGGIR